MTRIVLVLGVAAAIAAPAAALADSGGGTTSAPPALHGRVTARIERLEHRLDRRFAAFSARCLVANAPTRCSVAAHRAVRRLDWLERRVDRITARIQRVCGAAQAPKACSAKDEILAKLAELRAQAASDVAAVEAAFPNAGS